MAVLPQFTNTNHNTKLLTTWKGRIKMETKDWTGNKNSIYKTLGASNHTDEQRETNDYYATEPRAAELLLELEEFDHNIWECASGEGHLSQVFLEAGHNVKCSDLIDRTGDTEVIDFLKYEGTFDGDIITNPPYKYAREFVEKAIECIPEGHKVAMFLKLQFLEGKGRKDLFDKYPPETVYVSRGRLLCAKNGEFAKIKASGGSAVAYCWYIWRKGYTGNTSIKWFN